MLGVFVVYIERSQVFVLGTFFLKDGAQGIPNDVYIRHPQSMG